jgi:chromosomal replication initiator protein
MITNKIISIIISITAFIVIPVQMITTFVLGILVTLTFGLLLIPFNIIWVVLFLGPLLGLSYVYERVAITRPFIAIIGIPLAILGDTYIALLPLMGEMDSRYSKMICCQTFPYTWRYFQYNNCKLKINQDDILNKIFQEVSRAEPLRKYLDDLNQRIQQTNRLKNASYHKELWNNVLETIKEELSPQAYNSWFSQTKVDKFDGNELVILAPGDFCKDWLEKHYLDFIQDILHRNFDLDKNLKIEFMSTDQNYLKRPLEKNIITKNNNESTLLSKYTFDNFVVTNGNRFAHAACLAVAQSPSKPYNPLFIYGEDSLEKTHLIQAVGNYIIQKNPKTNVLYISAEKFTNEMINSVRDDRTAAFREKYRSVDVLLIDDIQFLAGKESAQEEFFHTFNALHKANKQIVITSDRPPKDITGTDERLISRFEWGLTTDIQLPDFETRIAILRKKAQTENLSVPSEVIEFIAAKITFNPRQLEEVLTKIIAHSVLTKKNLSISLAWEVLKDIIPSENKRGFY